MNYYKMRVFQCVKTRKGVMYKNNNKYYKSVPITNISTVILDVSRSWHIDENLNIVYTYIKFRTSGRVVIVQSL